MKKKNILLTLACIVAMSFSANAQLGNVLKNAASKAFSDKVSIEKIPATLEEFQALQAELGTTPEGCIMLQLVAMEMYRRDQNIGTECLRLNNTDTNLSDMKRRLNELFRENDSYARPYLVSAMFKGAKPSNGYNPEKPYTIQLRKDPTKSDERSQMLKGYVKHYQLYSDGYDTPWRSIDVVQQKGDEYYRVSNCPAILTQCKEVDFDATEDWKELE
ncbi:MAG: hypothetical protein IJP44_04345 [Bacteroidales bacterium]|nr:hypothetical protein [Bacteroidales bacterium]